MIVCPVKDVLFATFSNGLWIIVDWEESSLTWSGEALWFSKQGDCLHVGLKSNRGFVRCLNQLSSEQWRKILAGEGLWVEAGPKGLLCSHPIKIEMGPEELRQSFPELNQEWEVQAYDKIAVF